MQNSQPDTQPDPNGSEATSTEMVSPLEAQLAELTKQAADYKEGWQRERADFINYKKRAEKEREEVALIGAVEAYSKLLPVLDDLDIAVANIPADRADDNVIKGFRIIHQKFVALLEAVGVKVISPLGEIFNPAYHEAIGEDADSGKPTGTVTIVLRRGYRYGERVLRPALVRVAG